MNLIQKWREKATGLVSIDDAYIYEQCADELEADPLYGNARELLAACQEAYIVLANMMCTLTALGNLSPEARTVVDNFYTLMDEKGHNGIGERLGDAICKTTGESEEQ